MSSRNISNDNMSGTTTITSTTSNTSNMRWGGEDTYFYGGAHGKQICVWMYIV